MSNIRQGQSQPVDLFAPLNDPASAFKAPAQASFIQGLISVIRETLATVVRSDRASPAVLLSSPSGIVYRVTVGNDGVLKSERVRG